MEKDKINSRRPEILAPAGNRSSFLAALSAGADAIYCGMKVFSARMEAKNFSIEELAPLTQLAHENGTKVYVALNSLLKPGEVNPAGQLLEQLVRWVQPDAIIVQDLSLVPLAAQVGFPGEVHLSTLANVSFPEALKPVRQNLGVHRVVVPRELSIDEIKTMAAACPADLRLEVFVHGALCYGVSGRCYWSSFLGGKSGLRGRCVQPCRRLYRQHDQPQRFFSCLDLSVDVLVKILMDIPEVIAWKIEGRKKGPHYVYYTVKAYQMLRDHAHDPQMKKTALKFLDYALGRKGSHYYFLPQRPQIPIQADMETGSGLLVGKINGTPAQPYIFAREELLPSDLLRIGYEDAPWHQVCRVNRYVPPKSRFFFTGLTRRSPDKHVPVFLVDRSEHAIQKMVDQLEKKLGTLPSGKIAEGASFQARLPGRSKTAPGVVEDSVYREPLGENQRADTGYWLSDKTRDAGRGRESSLWWWLSPVIWPDNESEVKALIRHVRRQGAAKFVLNAPWQVGLFPDAKELTLWAGPFCNLANSLAIGRLKTIGFTGAIVSPELGREDFLKIPESSPLPLGIVIAGSWPLCISRTLFEKLSVEKLFTSPKNEQAWVKQYGSDYWVYPNWEVNLTDRKDELKKAGYRRFVRLVESVPKDVRLRERPGLWNWNQKLL